MKLIGDFISDLTKALGLKESRCGGCARRRKKLNAMHARLRGGGSTRACAECARAKGTKS
jgi:hypothetical protein